MVVSAVATTSVSRAVMSEATAARASTHRLRRIVDPFMPDRRTGGAGFDIRRAGRHPRAAMRRPRNRRSAALGARSTAIA